MENKMLSSSSSSEKHEFDEYEEEKMEKFYQIIRAFNEARNNQLSLFKSPFHKQNPKKKITQDLDDKPLMAVSDDATTTTWMPSFKWEDFRAVHHHHHHHHHHQVVDSDNSDVNFRNHTSDCVDNHNDSDIKKFDNKFGKKRKINQVVEEDETTAATRTYRQKYDNGLDLNLAL